jgi:hypothetical protein
MKEEVEMKKLAILLVLGLALPAWASLIYDYGWEDGGTVLGVYNLVTAANVVAPDPVHAGAHSLRLTKGDASTDQAYVAWIKGLTTGDQVTVSFWGYDTTSGNPSLRIWAHYNDSPTDPMQFDTSASGSSTYTGSTGWTQLSYTWTMPAGHTGLMIEARAYGAINAQLWVDDIRVTAPDTATVRFAPEPTGLLLLAFLGLFRRR